MRRRHLLTTAAGALLAAPLCALARAEATPRVVGFRGVAAGPNHLPDLAGLRLGLEQLGHVPDRTVVLEER